MLYTMGQMWPFLIVALLLGVATGWLAARSV
jgi:hypothetical protein